MNDAEIIQLYWTRDETAIAETKAVYEAYCHCIANNILNCQEDADECVNDTWMRTWNAIPPSRPKLFRMFLAKITRNLAFDRFKSRNAQKRGETLTVALDELGECVAASSNVEAEVSGKELGQAIDRFLLRLPERERNVFLRRYFFVDSISDIALRYALKENHVLVILSRTRQRLKTYLEKEGYLS